MTIHKSAPKDVVVVLDELDQFTEPTRLPNCGGIVTPP